jgi:anti-anti-sigma regulatory factor
VAGWRAVVATTQEYRSAGGRVRLVSLPPIASRLLHVTGYDKAFELDSRSADERRFSNCRT